MRFKAITFDAMYEDPKPTMVAKYLIPAHAFLLPTVLETESSKVAPLSAKFFQNIRIIIAAVRAAIGIDKFNRIVLQGAPYITTRIGTPADIRATNNPLAKTVVDFSWFPCLTIHIVFKPGRAC